jgi:signal transduction histidine kinase
MKNKLHILNNITAAVIAAVLFVPFMISFILYRTTDFNQYDNTSRLLVSGQKNEIEAGVYKKGEYPYIVFDLAGKVLYADPEFNMNEGDAVNVQEMLQYDRSFAKNNKDKSKESFILQKNGVTNGFIIFMIPRSELYFDTIKSKSLVIFIPGIVGIIISIILLVIRTVYFNRRVLGPLKEISTSAKGIITGNYDLEVLRTYWKRVNENEVGDLSYAFELMRDELKEKQVREEALKKSQQELISCISHDLKTPISTIKAYSEGLRDHIARTKEQKKEFIDTVINKTDLLIGMINELLEYSNAQLKQMEINREELYFHNYFNPLMKEIDIYVRQNGMEFSYIPNLPNMLVTIDPKRITEVIYNLVENSIKYRSMKNGRITIETERDGSFVLIKVKDNGIGISADDIPYVFDKFYRAEKSRSISIPGSGLGLSICKYIINEHGGEIYCRSDNRSGCEIGFTLQ